jgi:asparagine synthase (glutamine-hydrolysing)
VYAEEDALRRRLRATLEATVARMLPAGPVAASVSGGIDSSLVAAVAHHLGAAVTTFSITFGPPHADELAWSGLLARHLGVPHLPVLVRPEDVVAGLDRTVGALSEPNGDPLTVPNHLMFEAARARGLDVMLNGEGGDPCFGGPKNAPMMLAELYGDQRPLAREHDYLRAHQRMWDDLPALARGELAEVLATGLAEGCVTPWLDDPRWPSRLDRLMALNVAWKGAGHILPKVEHLGQRSGVRARSPLFDREVVDLAFQIPARLKRAGAVEKHLLKAAVADLVPEAIRERPKSGMMVPVESWFSGPLAGFAAERLLDGALPFDCIDRGWVEALVRGRTGGLRPRRGVKIWLLLTLEAWIRRVLRAE